MIHALRMLAWTFLQLCLLRRAPQDIPASSVLLAITLLLRFVLSLPLFADDPALRQRYFVLGNVFECLYLMLFVYVVLLLCGKLDRWRQKVTALAAAGLIISLASLPGLLLIPAGFPQALMWAALILWSVIVTVALVYYLLITAVFGLVGLAYSISESP